MGTIHPLQQERQSIWSQMQVQWLDVAVGGAIETRTVWW